MLAGVSGGQYARGAIPIMAIAQRVPGSRPQCCEQGTGLARQPAVGTTCGVMEAAQELLLPAKTFFEPDDRQPQEERVATDRSQAQIVRSLNSKVACAILFTNSVDKEVQLVWMDYSGEARSAAYSAATCMGPPGTRMGT